MSKVIKGDRTYVKGVTVVGQRLQALKDDSVALILSCRFPPAPGADGQEEEVDVFLNFKDSQAETSYRILKSMGFDQVDITPLEEGEEGFHDLRGSLLNLVRKEGSKYWNVDLPPKKIDMAKTRKFFQQEYLVEAHGGKDPFPN